MSNTPQSPSNIIISELNRIRGSLERIEQQESAAKLAVQTLYAELDSYKSEFLLQMEKHMLLDLLGFYDQLQFQVQTNGASSDLLEDFVELLAKRDVFATPETETFDPKFQRVLQTKHTSDPTQDQRIAQIVKKGFLRKEKILRVEDVVIYQYLSNPE